MNQINWANLAAVTAVVAFVSAFMSWYVKVSIKSALADFLEKLNGRYTHRSLCKEKHMDLERRLDVLEERGHHAG